MKKNSELVVSGEITGRGIKIKVNHQVFEIKYLKKIWQVIPLSLKEILLENLTFGNTHLLPLILNKEKIIYKTNYPLSEPFLFKNQLYDLLVCEKYDQVKSLSYLKKFYNLTFDFKSPQSTLPKKTDWSNFKTENKAVLPFTFGKESLTTLGICLELGIKPILFYCQEPAHPFEEEFKLKKLKDFKKEFFINYYFVKNDPGNFRYGKAFQKKFKTELGWGTQTTLLALLAIPFVYFYQAKYIFFGSEASNNDFELSDGWKLYYSYDQTSYFTPAQTSLIRQLTFDNCYIKSVLEPLEQIHIFYILFHRYPKLFKYLFSCEAKKPLYRNSPWCHQCYKCSKIFFFCQLFNINQNILGFKKNLNLEKKLFDDYFDPSGDPDYDLDFCFYLLLKRNFNSYYVEKFKKYKLKNIKPFKWYVNYFSHLKNSANLPIEYKNKIIRIFNEELVSFKKKLSL